jgi:predicted AlkP superfamily pyrophosphatase or phosphodiesterase
MTAPSHHPRRTNRPDRLAPARYGRRMIRRIALIASIVCALAAGSAQARPRLGVLVVFDQLRVVELERYAPFFGDGGFGGLDGARYDAWYGYASTETGPGHATLVTGANPRVHGIALNSWYARSDSGFARRYAVDDPRFPVHGATDKSGRSAMMLAAPTLGDAMKFESHERARVVSISLKDRSAILTGGRSADLAIWYDAAIGRYTTSTAYVDALPPWLAALGTELPKRACDTIVWEPLPLPPKLAALAPPDDRAGEASHEGLTRTFPHDLKGQPEPLKRKLYRIVPHAMEDLVDLSLRAVDEMQLGDDEEPDLLIVSFSTTDYIGHNFGPDSLEELDTLRRADVALRRLLAGLEARVGRRNFNVVLSSDHGSSPPPLAKVQSRVPNGVAALSAIEKAAQEGARLALPNDKRARLLGLSMPELFLDTTSLSPLDERRLIDAVAAAVRGVPGVAHVYDMTRENRDDAFSGFMEETAFPGRHGQLFVRTEPRFLPLENADSAGTDHGSPYTYDRRVPFIVSGPGVRKGRFALPVDPRDAAATLAFLLGVPPPDASQGKPVPAVGD